MRSASRSMTVSSHGIFKYAEIGPDARPLGADRIEFDVDPGGAHPVAADARDRQFGAQRAHGPAQKRRLKVARSFAGDDEDVFAHCLALEDAAVRLDLEEREQLLTFARRRDLPQLLDRGRERHVRVAQQPVRLFEFGDRVAGDARALESLEVEAPQARRIPFDGRERQDVFLHFAVAADHRHAADPDELMHARHAADVRAVAHVHMACELAQIRHHDAIPDHAIMRDVHVREQVIVVSDHRLGFGARCRG